MSGDHDHVDMLALYHDHDVFHYVIVGFNAETRRDSSEGKNRLALDQALLRMSSCLLQLSLIHIW